MELVFVGLGLVQLVLDPFLWGVASYTLFLLIVRRDRGWQIGAWTSAVLFFVWDEVVWNTVLARAGMSFSDDSLAELMTGDVWEISVGDAALSIGLAFGGYVVGRILVKKAAAALARDASGGLGLWASSLGVVPSEFD